MRLQPRLTMLRPSPLGIGMGSVPLAVQSLVKGVCKWHQRTTQPIVARTMVSEGAGSEKARKMLPHSGTDHQIHIFPRPQAVAGHSGRPSPLLDSLEIALQICREVNLKYLMTERPHSDMEESDREPMRRSYVTYNNSVQQLDHDFADSGTAQCLHLATRLRLVEFFTTTTALMRSMVQMSQHLHTKQTRLIPSRLPRHHSRYSRADWRCNCCWIIVPKRSFE